MRQGAATDGEVLGDHAQVHVPALEVAYDVVVGRLERESRDVVCQRVLGKDLGGLLDSIVLIFNHSNNHVLEKQIGLTGVRVRLGKLAASESIVAIVELCDVSPVVLRDGELAARVNLLVTIHPQH